MKRSHQSEAILAALIAAETRQKKTFLQWLRWLWNDYWRTASVNLLD